MSFTTIPQSTLPENRPTRLETHPSGYSLTSKPGQPIHSRRPSPYPLLPRHLPTDFGPHNFWAVELDPHFTGLQYTGRHRRAGKPLEPFQRPAPRSEAEYTARLQEIAWDRFIRKTAELAACHVRQVKPPLAVRVATAIKRAFGTITRTSRATRVPRTLPAEDVQFY